VGDGVGVQFPLKKVECVVLGRLVTIYLLIGGILWKSGGRKSCELGKSPFKACGSRRIVSGGIVEDEHYSLFAAVQLFLVGRLALLLILLAACCFVKARPSFLMVVTITLSA
jgi:hypothetical protein